MLGSQKAKLRSSDLILLAREMKRVHQSQIKVGAFRLTSAYLWPSSTDGLEGNSFWTVQKEPKGDQTVLGARILRHTQINILHVWSKEQGPDALFFI